MDPEDSMKRSNLSVRLVEVSFAVCLFRGVLWFAYVENIIFCQVMGLQIFLCYYF